MQQREVEIINKLGLHARASAKLTQLAARYQSDVQMSRNGRKVNAKSIMGVMMLAAGKGSKVRIEVEGPDEASVMRVRERLGLASRPIVKSGYISLLMSYLQERGQTTKDVRFEER